MNEVGHVKKKLIIPSFGEFLEESCGICPTVQVGPDGNLVVLLQVICPYY